MACHGLTGLFTDGQWWPARDDSDAYGNSSFTVIASDSAYRLRVAYYFFRALLKLKVIEVLFHL